MSARPADKLWLRIFRLMLGVILFWLPGAAKAEPLVYEFSGSISAILTDGAGLISVRGVNVGDPVKYAFAVDPEKRATVLHQDGTIEKLPLSPTPNGEGSTRHFFCEFLSGDVLSDAAAAQVSENGALDANDGFLQSYPSRETCGLGGIGRRYSIGVRKIREPRRTPPLPWGFTDESPDVRFWTIGEAVIGECLVVDSIGNVSIFEAQLTLDRISDRFAGAPFSSEAAGNYALFGTALRDVPAGAGQLTLTRQGTFTGKIQFLGRGYASFRGAFDAGGRGKALLFPGTKLELLHTPEGELHVTVKQEHKGWVSRTGFTPRRVAAGSGTAGECVVSLIPTGNAQETVVSDSSAVISLDSQGTVRVSGNSVAGRPFAVASKLCEDGSFWFYFGKRTVERTGSSINRIEEENYGRVILRRDEAGLHAEGLLDGYLSPPPVQNYREVTSTAASIGNFVAPPASSKVD